MQEKKAYLYEQLIIEIKNIFKLFYIFILIQILTCHFSKPLKGIFKETNLSTKASIIAFKALNPCLMEQHKLNFN